MILFINTFISDQGFTKYERGLLPDSNPLEVFKYSLASYSVIDWSQVVIYYELDEPYQKEEQHLDNYIKSLFPDSLVYAQRNQRQWEWQAAMERLFESSDDELVWFSCNHDHVFIDYETGLLERITNRLRSMAEEYEYVSCFPTHFSIMQLEGRTSPSGIIEECDDYFVTVWGLQASFQIVNTKLLRYWWFEHDYKDNWLPRSDPPPPNPPVISPDIACILPNRELVRHFDGYQESFNGHVKIDICPPLFIPEGFFEDDIQILYCADERKEGFVHVNPLIKNYSSVDAEGADLKCTLDDLPLFWRSRISLVESPNYLDNKTVLKRRNDAVLVNAWALFQTPLSSLKVALLSDELPIKHKEWLRLRFVEIKFKVRRRFRSFCGRLLRTNSLGIKLVSYINQRRY